jgi:hypothetical protein
MSPEQARDPGAADTRSDIWSLGATLYHALCGRPPFAGESVAEILSGVLYHPIVDPRQLAPRISKGMTLVLRKCLARDPARRYSTPGELLADLERLRERRAPRVNARFLDPLAPRWPSWVPRSAALVGGLGLLVAIWLLNPWGVSREDGGGTSSGSAPDWPELADVENRFAQGAIHSAAALALLEGMRLPEGLAYQVQRNDLRTRVRAQVEAELANFRVSAQRGMEAFLKDSNFDAALDWLESGAERELEAKTGFRRLADLPPELTPRKYQTALDELISMVRVRREAAVTRARDELVRHCEKAVLPELRAIIAH